MTGTIDGTGDGSTICAIGERDGKVVLSFPHPVREISVDPEQARQMGEQFARSAYSAHFGSASQMTKSIVSEQIRRKLKARATLVIRSLFDDGRTPDYIADHLVDLLLSEVT